MNQITKKELIPKITEENVTAIEIIRNHKKPTECSVIINDDLFSIPYITTYDFELLKIIKENIHENTLVILFNDDELPKAWADSYTAGGIPEERHDRRVIFHPFNDMNEMFCIDQTILYDITDEFKGTPHELTEEKCAWRWNIIQWYKAHLI